MRTLAGVTPGHKQVPGDRSEARPGAAVRSDLETRDTKVAKRSPLARLATREAVTGTKPASLKALTQKRLHHPLTIVIIWLPVRRFKK